MYHHLNIAINVKRGICRSVLTFAWASLELKFMALVFSLVVGGVPDDLRLTSSLIYVPHHLSIAIQIKCW